MNNAYAIDVTAKRAELQKELGTEHVTIERRGTKVRITKQGDGYTVELPVDRPFSEAIDEARNVRKASEHGAKHGALPRRNSNLSRTRIERRRDRQHRPPIRKPRSAVSTSRLPMGQMSRLSSMAT